MEEKNESKVKKKLIFIKENHNLIVIIFTGITIFITQVLKFIEYLNYQIYFSYFDIDRSFINYNNNSFLYDAFLSMILTSILLMIFLIYADIAEEWKKYKFKSFNIYINILIITVINFFILILNTYYDLIVFSLVILLILEFISYLIFNKVFKSFKLINTITITETKNSIKFIPLILGILVFWIMIVKTLDVQQTKEFRIINNNQVILYTTEEYYIVSECTIDNKNILNIKKGNQKVISIQNISSEKTKFDSVNFY